MTNKLFSFNSMNVYFVHWLFNDFIFLINNTNQCFQLQNLLCECNRLYSHKWFNIVIIIILTILHMYKHMYAHIDKSLTHTHIFIYFVYMHKCTCTTSYLLVGPMCWWRLVFKYFDLTIFLFWVFQILGTNGPLPPKSKEPLPHWYVAY